MLHVICAHEPFLDPRIQWTADLANKHLSEVRVCGWIAHADPDAEPGPLAAKRLGHTSDRTTSIRFSGCMAEFMPLSWKLLAGLIAAVLALPGIVVGLAVLLWRLVEVVAARLHVHDRVVAPINRWAARQRARLFNTLDKRLDGRLTDLYNGLAGYKWYFIDHAKPFAEAYLSWLEAEPDQIPDTIHANDPDALFVAVVANRKYGCKVIYDAHEYGPDAYLIHPRPRQAFFLYERVLMGHVAAAVTVSPPIADKFNARYRGRPRFDVIPNASPLESDASPMPDDPMVALAGDRVRVLYQGGFAPHRGLEELIDDWPLVDGSRAALFLRGPDNAFRKTLVDRARQRGLLDQSVYILPSIPEDLLTRGAANAHIGVIPYLSRIENHAGACPNKLGQYMQAGLAILAARLPFVESVLEWGECGETYDDTVPGSFASHVTALLDDPERIDALGSAGRSYANSTYNYDAYFPALLALYRVDSTGN